MLMRVLRAKPAVTTGRAAPLPYFRASSHAPDIAFASNMASVESYITSSADHQDAVFRLIQYSAKLLGSLHYGRRREALAGIAGSIDISRIMMRTFGIIYALRSVLTSKGDKPRVAWLSDMSLLLYHPCETSYWLLTVSNWEARTSWENSRRRTFSRLSSFFGFLWSVFASIASTRRLRQLRAAQLSLKLAQDEAHALGDDKTGVAISAQEPDGGRTMQLLNEDIAALATDASVERQRLIKLLLDATMNLNWAIDHPTRGLSSFGIGLLGAASAWFGLRLSYDAHAQAIEEAEAEDARWANGSDEDDDGEEGEEEGVGEEEEEEGGMS